MSPIAETPQELLVDRSGDSEKLRAYTRRKLAIAAQLRALLDLLKERGSEARFHRCEELMVKLAEDRFTLAVVGQFKRGKSSLMNAIIGRELLPTGVLPLTSAITVLKFGPAERLVVRRESSVFPEIVPVSALASYVTEKGNPGNRKKVKTATVEVPLPFLRRGLEFVDTPGVGSAIEANTATTYGFLPECDAMLFVTSVDTPFTGTELDFLHAIRDHVSKIFFVVNKTDLLHDEGERAEVLKFVESEICAEMKTARVRIFPVSSKLALAGNENAESGLPALQETLATFLSEEKSAVFLAAVIDKLLRIVEEESGDLELPQRARELPEEAMRERMDALRKGWEKLAAARQKLLAQFREDCLQRAREMATQALDHLLETESEELTRDLDRLTAHSGWSLGEELAERWSELVSPRVRKVLAQWLRDITPQLEAAAEASAEMQQSLEENLSKIPALAADAFGLKPDPPEDLLPRLGARAAFDQRLESSRVERSLKWFSFLPSCLIRRSLKTALKRETDDFLRNCRNQALELIAESAKRMTEQIANQVNAAAGELQSRLTVAITGEPPANTGWRQSSAPRRDEGWGNATLAPIRDKLLALQADIADFAESAPIQADQPQSPFPEPSTASPNDDLAITEARETDLTQDLKTRGCAVCDHFVKTAFHFFAHWQYAISADEKAQSQFAREQGFCPLHMWQLHAVSSTLGESIGLARLIEQASGLLKQTERSANAGSRLRSSGDCRVCQLVRQSETDYIHRLAAFVSEKAGRETYASSQGVCLRHLAALLPHVSDEVAQFLRREAARHFDETAEDMQSYAIKRDALRRTLGNKDEEDAAERALIHFAGAKDVCTPWPEDREI